MSGYILRGGQENITLPAAAAESLLKRGDGDAALLYLALLPVGQQGVQRQKDPDAP